MSHFARRHFVTLLALLALSPALHAELLYESNRVELYRVNAPQGVRNDHPMRLETYALEDRLAEVSLVLPNRRSEPLLDEKTRLNLGEQLAQALRRLDPEDELHMIAYRVDKSGFLSSKRYASSARAFVKDGQLNLIFGGLEQFQNEFRDPGKPLPPMGSRTRPSTLAGELQVSGAAQLAEGRSDWVLIPVTEPAARGATSRAAPTPAAPAPAPAKPTVTWQEVEEGLATLDRMRQRGLITQEDYDRMKKRLLESAAPASR